MRSPLLIIFFHLLSVSLTLGQESTTAPRGIFWEDSVKMGGLIQYSLTYEYPIDSKLIYPDSSYNFFPFEYVKKEFFPTVKTDSTTLKDSVIYTLATYELDSIFYLRIPVFILQNKDSLTFFAEPDSVYFASVVNEIPENPELLADTSLQEVPLQFNYIYLIIGLVAVLIILTVLILLFGKKVYRMIIIYRLNSSFKKFYNKYKNLIADINQTDSIEDTKAILLVWKNYLEKLDRKPITKLTTKEIAMVYPSENLKDTLRALDRSMYGGMKPENIFALCGTLEQFSRERLNHKIEEVKNG